ncbi:MAG: phosphate ABC transporter permease subunit PstC [Acidimicrobiales bacterium]
MSTIEVGGNSPRSPLLGGQGDAADRWFKAVTVGAGAIVLLILVGIIVSTTSKAWPVFTKEGLGYFTGRTFDPGKQSYGILAYVYGTILVSAIAIAIAVPVSLGIALFMTEVAPRRARSAITSVIDLLASVPSVVFGLWGLLVLAPKLNDLFANVHDAVASVPVLKNIFGPSGGGRSFMTAGMIVALMITPIITSITREVFLTVPRNDKDGALALGATRWEMIRSVVLPHSNGGLVGAVMLGLGRAMGETIAIALLVGANPQIVGNLFAAGETMPSLIVRNLPESSGDYQAALIGLGVVLFAITIGVNVVARVLVSRIDGRIKGAAA